MHIPTGQGAASECLSQHQTADTCHMTHTKHMHWIPNQIGDKYLTHPMGCCYTPGCSNNDKVDEANIFDNSVAKIPAKGLPNLDAIAEPEVW